MPDFTAGVDTTEGPMSLFFTRIHTVRGTVYFTNAVGKNSRFSFYTEKRNGAWKIVQAPKPPGWFLSYEDQVATIIEKNESS